MALGARDALVSAPEREAGARVIERAQAQRAPAAHVVAALTARPEAALVRIFVTGSTRRLEAEERARAALVALVVAFAAAHAAMTAGERVAGEIVIEALS